MKYHLGGIFFPLVKRGIFFFWFRKRNTVHINSAHWMPTLGDPGAHPEKEWGRLHLPALKEVLKVWQQLQGADESGEGKWREGGCQKQT